MSKLEELKKIRNELNLKIIGKENYPTDAPSVIITNYDRLADIFYLPMAIDEDIISLIDSRLVYTQDFDRLNIVNKYLNAFPVEINGGKTYLDMCLKQACKLLIRGKSLSMCPECAYTEKNDSVHKGRTMAAKVLFRSLYYYNFAYLLPVSIDVQSSNNVDYYNISKNDKIKIEILKPISPIKYYRDFNEAYEKDKNNALHEIIDIGMKQIATSLNRKYVDEYTKLDFQENVIFKYGSLIDSSVAQNEEYINEYSNDLHNLSLKLLSECGDGR